METYKLFTKEPVKDIENIILFKAIPLSLEKIADNLEKNNFVITKQEIINKIPCLIFNGMFLLRKRNEEGKKLYELFHGCVLAAFLNSIEPNFQHNVYYPENQSYDFLIIKYPITEKVNIKLLSNKEIFKNPNIFKIELAELIKFEDLEKIIINKSKYKDRVLLISIAFIGKINFQDIFEIASKANQNKFETIWLIGQTNNPEKKDRLCYFIAELIKYKKVFPLFELNIDLKKIKKQLIKALEI